MIVKNFIYKNGMNVLVPAKCGTRWVQEYTNFEGEIQLIPHTQILTVNNLINSKTKMIFRKPHHALISGLHTEYVWYNHTIEELINGFWENKFNHCSFDFWEHIYELWDILPFELIPQYDLTKFFGKIKSDFNPSHFDSHENENYISKDELKEKIGIDELKKMYDVIDVDALWLDRMIKNERGLVSQRILSNNKKIISDLELKILDIRKLNKINSDKQSETISFNNIQINNLNKKIINNKNEILKSVKILNSILGEENKLI